MPSLMENWILVINVGSTSVKTALFAEGIVLKATLNARQSPTEWLIDGQGLDDQPFTANLPKSSPVSSLVAGLLHNWQKLLNRAQIKLKAIGHRVVHGGTDFQDITRINNEFIDALSHLDAYAPLHNPINRLGITLARQSFPNTPQYAVFDTAFHRSIPEKASRYALPPQLADNLDFHRFGFHGISCQHSLITTAQWLEREEKTLNLIVLHLGGGASITAIQAGQSIDTSMGFSPLEGLVMATRSGDIDPTIILTLQKQGWTPEQLDQLLNHQSGLLGICGESDIRTIIDLAKMGDNEAQLALDIYCYRIQKYIGAYSAVLNPVHALIFTGGIGEHACTIRANILQNLSIPGISIDINRNESAQNGSDISQIDATVRILVIQAEEEREIARQIQADQTLNPNQARG